MQLRRIAADEPNRNSMPDLPQLSERPGNPTAPIEPFGEEPYALMIARWEGEGGQIPITYERNK
jgi:hypothetical protein